MKTKATTLILDYSLYPRHTVSEENVSRISDAMRSGVDLPAVIADRKTKKVVDGFHRVTATLRADPKATIEVSWKAYKDEAAMFADAMRLNASHGLRLTAYDRARCAALAENFGISVQDIAVALNMTPRKLGRLIEAKTSQSEGKVIPIKRTAVHLAGVEISAKQIEGNKKAAGPGQVFLINQVANLIETDLLDTGSEPVMDALRRLRRMLNETLTAAA